MRYAVERRWATLRMAADRVRLFAALSVAAGVAAGATWASSVTVTGDARAHLAAYAYVSWLASQELDDPVVLTVSRGRVLARPSMHRAHLAARYYDGRPFAELLAGPAVAAAGTAVSAVVVLTAWSALARSRRGEEILRGSRMYRPRALRLAIVVAVAGGRPARWLRRRLGVEEGDPWS